jgi:Phage ABA sandwich domain
MDADPDDLDRRIAEAIGWTDVHLGRDGIWVGRSPAMPLGQVRAVPPYSRNLESAWSVVQWMWQTRRLGVAVGGHDGCWWADFSVADCALLGDAKGLTAPEAICRAALAALADQGTV